MITQSDGCDWQYGQEDVWLKHLQLLCPTGGTVLTVDI